MGRQDSQRSSQHGKGRKKGLANEKKKPGPHISVRGRGTQGKVTTESKLGFKLQARGGALSKKNYWTEPGG